ncbi:MAG: iron ABC transporter permease [Candidatus Hydrogenedentes bacterium]|nr:iron ABC transporter permease [Candidatus Hydrogenedentota bacterium]
MKRRAVLLMLVAGSIGVLAVAPFVGSRDVSFDTVLRPGADDWAASIFWKMRVPRALTGFLAGSSLALGGLAFQALFRNPLATPFTLGVSSGASFGAVLCLRLGWTFSFAGVPSTVLAAFVGAVLCVLAVYGLVMSTGSFSTSRLLLAGVAVSFFFSSLITLVHYTSGMLDNFRLMRWLMGGLAMSDYSAALRLAPFTAGGALLLGFLAHELNLLATGEELALSRGVNVGRTRYTLFFATALMEGSVVAVCGPIGFVGIMVPHMCRLALGTDHRYLLPASFLAGGAFLVLSDSIARTIAMPAEIPVGVITALLGGPFFLWLLLGKSAGELEW